MRAWHGSAEAAAAVLTPPLSAPSHCSASTPTALDATRSFGVIARLHPLTGGNLRSVLQPMPGCGGCLLKVSVEVSSSQPRSQAWRMPRGRSIAIPWHAAYLEPGRIARMYKLDSSCVKGDR